LLFDGISLSVNRNVITKSAANKLYRDLVTLPTEVDVAIDPRVIAFLGDAGSKISTPSSSADVLTKLHSLIQQDHDAAWNQGENAIVRVEYLQGTVHNQALDLIEQVIPQQVTEPEGTIHLYISSPDTAALDNHTDTTDIYDMQLDGAKEWFVCVPDKTA
jgi:hypothetical protein